MFKYQFIYHRLPSLNSLSFPPLSKTLPIFSLPSFASSSGSQTAQMKLSISATHILSITSCSFLTHGHITSQNLYHAIPTTQSNAIINNTHPFQIRQHPNPTIEFLKIRHNSPQSPFTNPPAASHRTQLPPDPLQSRPPQFPLHTQQFPTPNLISKLQISPPYLTPVLLFADVR